MRRGCRMLAAALALWLCVFQGGCARKELHQRILIQGIGVDREAEGYKVTVRASTSTEDQGEELFTCRGETVLEALSSLSLSTGREPFYAHNYLVVFGEGCGEEGLDRSLDFFIRYYNTRPAVGLYFTQGSAAEVLSFEQDGALFPMQDLQALSQTGEENGASVSTDLLEFVNSGRRPGSSPVLPLLQVEGEQVSLEGAAYFREYVLAGTLSLQETRGYLAAQGDLSGGEWVVTGPGLGTVTLSLSGGKGKKSVSLSQEGKPVFLVQAEVNADVSSVSGEEDLGEDFYQRLEETASQQLQEGMEALWEKAARRSHCDLLGLGNLLSQQFPRVWEELEDIWDQEMARCSVEFQSAVRVARMEQNTVPVGEPVRWERGRGPGLP